MPNQEPASAWIFGNSSVRVGTQGLFRPYLKTFVPPFLPTRLTAPGSPRMYTCRKLVAGTVRISTLAKPNGDCITEKLNTSRQSPAMVIHQLLQNTSLHWLQLVTIWLGPFWHLFKRKSDTHCKIKETLLIRDLKPALNENISSKKLHLY